MTQNLVKNIIGNVASRYQAHVAIEIPNITENYINSLSLVNIGYLQCLLKYMSRCWEVFFGKFFFFGHIFFYLGGLGANWNVLGKTQYEISYTCSIATKTCSIATCTFKRATCIVKLT